MISPELGSRIGFIGLGNMGTPMTRRLVDAGFRVTGFDLSEESRTRLVAAGGLASETVDGAVQGADAVILMLPNSAVVESVLDSVSVPIASPVIDMSSSEPLRTRALAARLAERGVTLLDAPVSGGVAGAERGSLTIMAGGAAEDVAAVAPALGALGKVVHAGPVGAGHAAKALNNLLSATHLWVTSEAMVTGERFGIDPATLLTIFNGSSGRSGSTENKWPNFILTEGYDSGFGLRLMVKDMAIAVGLACELGVGIELGEDALELWQRAADELPPTADHTEVARLLRKG